MTVWCWQVCYYEAVAALRRYKIRPPRVLRCPPTLNPLTQMSTSSRTVDLGRGSANVALGLRVA